MKRKALIIACVALAVALAYHYRQVCPDLHCVITTDKQLAAKFDETMPLFIESSTSQPLLKTSPAWSDDPKIKHMLDVLDTNTAQMKQSMGTHASCAVVGSSQNLLGSGYGKQIDGHDFIFRINSAPTNPYETDVGTRTTHHVFAVGNLHNQRTIPYSEDTYQVLIPLASSIPDFYDSSKQKDYSTFAQSFDSLSHALSDPSDTSLELARDNYAQLAKFPHLVVLSPEFLWYTNYVWFTPTDRQRGEIASTGFLTVILAFHLCDSVDLYGFGADKNGFWGHYFAPQKEKPARHRPAYQEQFIHDMEDKRAIRVYRGK